MPRSKGDEHKSSNCACAARLNIAKPNLTHTFPSDGQQLGEEGSPKREEFAEDGGVHGEEGVPRGDFDNLVEQANIGQAGDLGGLVASVKYLQVRELIGPYLV